MPTWLAADELDFRGGMAVAQGWLRRAHRLLDPLEPVPAHGWLPFHEGTSRTRAETRQRRASSESAPPSSPSRWVEADAESLPFGDASFDVVTSCFGAMFALDHETVASELVRVCRPGGTIGLASFTPRGTGAAFFDVLARHAPPPPAGVLPPVLWGDEEHVRSLFRDRVASLDVQRRTYTERAASPADYRRLFEETFGPLIALRATLATDLDRAAALDRDFADFTERANEGRADGPAEYVYEYLLAVARTR